MQDESVKETTSFLSVHDYLTAVLQDYQDLRDEIKLRINMRNGIVIAFGTGAAVVIGKILFAEEPFAPTLSSRIMFLVILPAIWFFIFTFQVVLMAQVDRAARVLTIIERKVQLLFTLAGDQSLKSTIKQMRIELHSELAESQYPTTQFWSDAMFWERFLRSQRRASVVRSRWWDSPWRRNIPCFMTATILSSVGAVILAVTGCLKCSSSLIWVCAYFVIGTISTLLSTRSTFVGPTVTPHSATPVACGDDDGV